VADPTRTLTIGLSTREEFNDRVRRAFSGERMGTFRTFATPELMWRVITTKREEIMQCMMGQEPMSIREVARRVGRDIKAVHGDVRSLVAGGLVEETKDGRVVFPYDEIRVNYVLGPRKAAAA
jgi:predicted transcriptional regulator